MEMDVNCIFTIFSVALLLSLISITIFSNPLSLCLSLVSSSLCLGFLTWLLISNWLSLAIILIFVGGMMVTFLYVSSLALNQKLFWPSSSQHRVFLFLSVAILILPLNLVDTNLPPLLVPTLEIIFTAPMASLVIFLLSLLLLLLLILVKISESFKGSLKQRF